MSVTLTQLRELATNVLLATSVTTLWLNHRQAVTTALELTDAVLLVLPMLALSVSSVLITGLTASDLAPVRMIHLTGSWPVGTVDRGTIPTSLAGPTRFCSEVATAVKEVATDHLTVSNANSEKSSSSWTHSSRSTENTLGVDSERAVELSLSLITTSAPTTILLSHQLLSMNWIEITSKLITGLMKTTTTTVVPLSKQFLTVSLFSLDLILVSSHKA